MGSFFELNHKKAPTSTMKSKILIAILLVSTNLTQADFVITNDGSKLTGKITLIDKGIIHLETSYAGILEIKQEETVSFQTDTPVASTSKATLSTVRSTSAGKVRTESSNGIPETHTAKVVASWTSTSEDPEIVRLRAEQEAMQRKWKFRSTLDLLGKTGNTEKLNFGGKFEAKLESPDDELNFFAEYEQGQENGNKTDDRLAGGTSYEAFFTKIFGWYVRTDLEADKIDHIDLRSTSGAGFSYRLINEERQILVFRSGLGYRYTAYDSDNRNESSATIDLGIKHTYTFRDNIHMENSFSYVPSSEDFGLYTMVHDSGIEIPFDNGNNWKIRIGMKNEYEGEPATTEALDTSYYTKMVLSWD